MTPLYLILISLVLPRSINGAPGCCMLCCEDPSSKTKDLQTLNPSSTGSTSSGSLASLKPGPNIRPTVYPPSTIEYCDDPEEDHQLPDLGGAIGGARSPFSGKGGRPHVGKRPGGGGGVKRPGPLKGGKGKGKPRKPPHPSPPGGHPPAPPAAAGGSGSPSGWGKAGTVFDGINAGVGAGRLTMDAVNLANNNAAEGDDEEESEGGEGEAEAESA